MDKNPINSDANFNLKHEVQRYLSFWPYILISILLALTAQFIYIKKYADFKYLATAKIEIIDKAQDSEMALPTAMTVFNRSMINLENEIGVLKSYRIHEKVVKQTKANVEFYTVGTIKTSRNHIKDFYKDFEFELNVNADDIGIYRKFVVEADNNTNSLNISEFDSEDELVLEYNFNNFSTNSKKHSLPFELTVLETDDDDDLKNIIFVPFHSSVSSFKNSIEIDVIGSDSDQLSISHTSDNRLNSIDYINTLMIEFDKDGIVDRQMEYKRTMDFVDSRSKFLAEELQSIEIRKQNFKETNQLTDINADANFTFEQKILYDSSLFEYQAQLDLLDLLKNVISEGDKFDLLPINIGIKDDNITALINGFNTLLKERDLLGASAGPNNIFLIRKENEITDFKNNLNLSIDNYYKSLLVRIESNKDKEKELSNLYRDIPEKEKILRAINRELEVKESLFLLLLQKKEEAAINYAVVKPSIKIIDNALSSTVPISPNKQLILYASLLMGIFLPISFIYLWFLFDTKIHTREQLQDSLEDKSSVIVGEIPFIKTLDKHNLISSESRDPLSESIRMLLANLNFSLFTDIDENNKNKSENKVILVTSSIKSEGKTLISTNIALGLADRGKKVILVGSDLRNPQIHKLFGEDKSNLGLSDLIYRNDLNWKNYVNKSRNLDIIYSGTIPPNPTEILSSNKFKSLLDLLKKEYDYIVIDSAPCLLVSDTFEISKYVSKTVYVVRSNYTQKNLFDFINEIINQKRLPKVSFVLNSVGNSKSYGYSYGYQYGYRYSYKYNYGYGYGYGFDQDDN
tara:strand:+ start:108 stop:2513 length:2406 start_codon:yes stop_codon:yes gene_type:complete